MEMYILLLMNPRISRTIICDEASLAEPHSDVVEASSVLGPRLSASTLCNIECCGLCRTIEILADLACSSRRCIEERFQESHEFQSFLEDDEFLEVEFSVLDVHDHLLNLLCCFLTFARLFHGGP